MSGKQARRVVRSDPKKIRAETVARSPMTWLSAAVVGAVLLLAAAGITTIAERDWAAVVTVDGHTINRAQLRDREAVVAFLAQQRADWHASLVRSGRMDAAQAAQLQVEIDADVADPHAEAVESLIQATLVDEELARRGRSTNPKVDVVRELLDARLAATGQRVRWIRADWTANGDPTPPDEDELHDLGELIRSRLQAGNDLNTMTTELTRDPWTATSAERWIPTTGPVDGLDAEALAIIRSTPSGPVPIVTGIGSVVVAEVLDSGSVDPAAFGPSVLEDLQAAGVGPSAVDAWANAQVAARALRETLVAESAQPVEQVRAEELVLGPADIEGAKGPWVQLSHLVTGDLPADAVPIGTGKPADLLAAELRALPPADRSGKFEELVLAANRATSRSGELGYFVKEQLLAPIGNAALDPKAKRYDVIGPVNTDAGPELFLLEAQYRGALNDETTAAIMAATSSERSFSEIAQTRGSGSIGRSLGGPWRSRSELDAHDPAARELFETPIGGITSPMNLGGELVLARILERRTGEPDEDSRARTAVARWASWYQAARAAASITWADPMATAATSTDPLPTMLPQETPRIPVAPDGEAIP